MLLRNAVLQVVGGSKVSCVPMCGHQFRHDENELRSWSDSNLTIHCNGDEFVAVNKTC